MESKKINANDKSSRTLEYGQIGKFNEYPFLEKVFICSPLSGDITQNTENARRYARFAVEKGKIPFVPHLLFPQFLNEADKDERHLGLFFGLRFLADCDEVWVFGDTVSEGMEQELEKAREWNIPIKHFNADCEEC
jgi:hypothetical protein